MSYIIEVENLTKEFPIPSYIGYIRNIITAIDDISFQINSGEIFFFLDQMEAVKAHLSRCSVVLLYLQKVEYSSMAMR